MTKIIFTHLILFGIIVQNTAQTWQLIIPSTSYDGSQLNLSASAYDRVGNIIYSLRKDQSVNTLYAFNIQNNNVNQINTTNAPNELYSFTYDPNSSRIIAARAGREPVYAVSSNGGVWSSFGPGSSDYEHFGPQYYYNQNNNSVGFMGGYGFYSAKNAVWENDGNTWVEILPNDDNCGSSVPPRRTGVNPVLGSPGTNEIYFLSGQGSCTGSQTEPVCNLGSPWATDVGQWCWLRDLWKYDYLNNSFTQILPVNDASIQQEGDLAYDYVNNIFYLVGGYVPSAVYNPAVVPNFNSNVYRYRVGIDNGFVPLNVNGTAPQTLPLSNMGAHGAYFDAATNRIVWVRFDGVYSIELSGLGLDDTHNEFTLKPNPASENLTVNSEFNLLNKAYVIHDKMGRVVFTGKITGSVYTVPVQSLEAGFYTLKIEGIQSIQSFIKH